MQINADIDSDADADSQILNHTGTKTLRSLHFQLPDEMVVDLIQSDIYLMDIQFSVHMRLYNYFTVFIMS